VKGRNNYWKVRQAVETAKETLYSFDQLKTNKSEPRRPLRKMVINRIKTWQDNGGALAQCAILYRSNAQSRVLEEALLQASMPYR
ncbi:hypothetical protein ONO12_25950, partial [Salmonella enterica subsp. enterica serovar Montevideo]|nr:hypothetical protein [Salmonella enterica subsp. enterica serovar Montevideo]